MAKAIFKYGLMKYFIKCVIKKYVLLYIKKKSALVDQYEGHIQNLLRST